MNHQFRRGLIKFSKRFDNALVFGQIMSFYGPDTSTLRIRRLKGSASSMRVMVHEPKKPCGWDNKHTTENVGWMVIGN